MSFTRKYSRQAHVLRNSCLTLILPTKSVISSQFFFERLQRELKYYGNETLMCIPQVLNEDL
jgi:hypothetical protein